MNTLQKILLDTIVICDIN